MSPRSLLRCGSALAALALFACDAPKSSATADPSPSAQSSASAPQPGTPATVAATGPVLEFVQAPAVGNLTAWVKAQRETALAEGRKVVVYVGASWCEPCQRFHAAALAGKLDDKLPRTRFLEFDLDSDQLRLEIAGYKSKYIPLFSLPEPDGRSSGRQIEGSIKGEGAADEIAPRLSRLLAQ